MKNKVIDESHRESSINDYFVTFTGQSENYCIGLVDMVDSTRISANMHEQKWSTYYSVFLNTMAKIVHKFGGIPIKNGGDSLLYYFPESSKPNRKYGFLSCLECGLKMLESHDILCTRMEEENLPNLNYRISSDFGKVVIMKPNGCQNIDLVGPPLNMCSKINESANLNSLVIGGDFYENVKDVREYKFKQQKGFSIGLKHSYQIYSVTRNEKIF